MIIFLIVNNILVIFGIKFSLSYSEDDRDETGWEGGSSRYSFLIVFFLFLFILGKKIRKTKKNVQ